ncbi:uncharacterized protein L201_003937 [Kwoniella dendrophila CBS 6074]|uniref:Uncharacterized protein n=1 Tax=Kwoniella dendrophila CBS 6074 TaxID=1295534 RepID=A0AAX4JW49_9TREE
MLTEKFVPLLIESVSPNGKRLLFLTSGLSSIEVTEYENHPLAGSPSAGWPKEEYRHSGDQEHLKKLGAQDPSVSGHFVKEVIQGKRDYRIGKTVNGPGVQEVKGEVLSW